MSKKMTASEKMVSAAKRKSLADCNRAIGDGNAANFATSIVQQLDDLSEQRKQWETTDYKKANEGLYGLLAKCLGIFKDRFSKGSEADQKALRSELIARLTTDGVRVVKTSTTLTMLARFVFNSDRKRAQGYSYVLAAALSHQVEAKDFSEWVVQQGGIEELKRLMVKKPEAIAKQQAVAEAAVAVKGELELNSLQPLGHISIKGLTGTYAVLLAKPNVEGGADIVGALSEVNDALINALVLRMAKQQVTSQQADKELGRQVAKENGDLLAAANDERRLMVANG